MGKLVSFEASWGLWQGDIRPRGGGTPYNGINGEAPLERGTPFRFLRKAQQGYQMYRMAVEKSRKHSGFVITSHFKDSTFRDAKL